MTVYEFNVLYGGQPRTQDAQRLSKLGTRMKEELKLIAVLAGSDCGYAMQQTKRNASNNIYLEQLSIKTLLEGSTGNYADTYL